MFRKNEWCSGRMGVFRKNGWCSGRMGGVQEEWGCLGRMGGVQEEWGVLIKCYCIKTTLSSRLMLNKALLPLNCSRVIALELLESYCP